MRLIKITVILSCLIIAINWFFAPLRSAAMSPCQATDQCQGMGGDPYALCSAITNQEVCQAHQCCGWINLPGVLVSNENEEPESESGPELIIPDVKINLPGLLFSDQNKIQTSSDGENTFFYIPWIGEYLAWLYNYSIGIIAILALIAIMVGGFYWLLAGGNASRVTEAKSWIGAAFSGLGLALGSYLILATINSSLVRISSIKIMGIKKIDIQYEIRNDNISVMNMQLGPGDYCGCFSVESLTYDASGFNSQKVCNLINSINSGSPYNSYCSLINDLCKSFNVDPSYVIAQWIAESSLGTAGASKKHNNPGNFTCARVSGRQTNSGNGYSSSYSCVLGSDGKHVWRSYSNLRDGLIGYFINKRESNYLSGNIRANIYRYAPPSDNNDTNGYISMIVKFINQNSNNKHPGDKTNNGSCPCPTTR